jgi:rhodanese-related sulfurtransferase
VTVPAIGLDELRRRIEDGEDFVLVDALAPMSFAHSHLPGAINLPPERVDASVAKRLPDKGAEVVVYCANPECESSVETAAALVALGYTNVRHYAGGKDEWWDAELPLERAGAPIQLERRRRGH